MRILPVLTALAGIASATCLVVAARTPAYVDITGKLVEPFAWMVAGRVFLILFAIGAIASALFVLVGSMRRRRQIGSGQ